MLLDDFSGHNVEAAAALVEGAGRFLFRLPESQTRMANMLDVRARLLQWNDSRAATSVQCA